MDEVVGQITKANVAIKTCHRYAKYNEGGFIIYVEGVYDDFEGGGSQRFSSNFFQGIHKSTKSTCISDFRGGMNVKQGGVVVTEKGGHDFYHGLQGIE